MGRIQTLKKRTARPGRKFGWKLIATFLLIVAGYAAWTLLRPIPMLHPSQAYAHLSLATPAGSIAWPATGQAAIALSTGAVLAVNGQQTAVPIASTAKIITALSVLQQKPLKLGEQGPTYTVTADDVANYNNYIAQNGSVIPVTIGEQITEYQMLQALLLPSANNIGDTLAKWAFGSLKNYSAFANNYARHLGATNTTIGSDASGLAPDTVSNAHDLALFGQAAMQNPVLEQIVGQKSASNIPGVGTIQNVNFLLGRSGIVGIKTGNSDEAGGVFLGASRASANNSTVTVITAYVGARNLYDSLASSVKLIDSANANFGTSVLISAGAVVGSYQQPWGGRVPVAVQKDVAVTTWKGSKLMANVKLQDISTTVQRGQTVGSISVVPAGLAKATTGPLVLTGIISKPSIFWRLSHPM
ncbi:D-alanyl-D-alanine carboxypeptidase [Candidatus Saccharibacteria bacterium]|nr:D-alanyl-D-alanine carboxypeptidase [Candidatus Saccharibacteria bacterium]